MKVLLFDSNSFSKRVLDKLSDEEKYDVALSNKRIGADITEIFTLDEFQNFFNGHDCFEEWIYFVDIENA